MKKAEKTSLNTNRDPRSHSEATQLDRIEETLRELKEEIADLKAGFADAPAILPGPIDMQMAGVDDEEEEEERDPP